DVGEKDDARTHHDAADPELSELALVWRNERMVVFRVDEFPPNRDEDHDHRQLDGHNDAIGAGGFFDAEYQQQRNRADDAHARQIHNSLDHSAIRQSPRLE